MGGAGNWVEVGDLLTPHGAWAPGRFQVWEPAGSRLPRTGVDSELCATLRFPNNPLSQLSSANRQLRKGPRGLRAEAGAVRASVWTTLRGAGEEPGLGRGCVNRVALATH